jgi:cytoskeletal protein RodZ
MTEFHDPDLRHELGRLSGPYPDENAAFAAWQRRVGQARRRRAVAWTTAAALSLIVGTVAVAALQSPERSSLVPGKSADPSTDVSASSTVPETEARASSTTSSTTPLTEPATTAAATTAAETTPSSAAVETTLPEAQPPAAGTSPTGGTTNKGHSGSTTTVATPTTQPATQTFDSPGGSITVHLEGNELTVVATHASHGFHADQNRSGHEVHVTFRSGDERYEIAVRVTDGVMKSTVTHRTDNHDSTVPDDSSDTGHHGGGGDGGGNG